jgi:hypothetical protein
MMRGRSSEMPLIRLRLLVLFAAAVCAVLASATSATATPEAHILRIDPRTGLKNGKPLLTTVIEVVQFRRLSDALQPCAGARPAAVLSCWSEQLEKAGALWQPFPFPEQNAHLLVKVAGEDQLLKFADKAQWAKAQNEPNVGTAWLIAVDSASGMGSRFGDARTIAHEFIEEMQPNDLMDLMFFDDVQVVRDTKWKTFKQRADLGNALNEFKSTSPSHGHDRALFSQIKGMTQDAFGSLGNSDQPDAIPLHQAMVVLSNGAGRGDPESASPSADVFHQYLNRGRFPEDNTSLPKTPLPVVSIWLPNAASLLENVYRNNEAQFMQSLANPEIGGFFDIVQEGMGAAKAKAIISLVRARYNAMWLVHWTMSCINPSVEQSFNLVFENTHPTIAPDGTFKEVPIGLDPTAWPLDVDVEKTVKAAQDNPLSPGGQFTVYGDFCWSGDKQRAEGYFIPAGTNAAASQAGSRDPEAAKRMMQQLQAEHMLGTAVATGDGYATFSVPDDEKIMNGSGENAVARVVVYDNKAHRASAVDERGVLTLRAAKKPISLPLVLGVTGLVVVVVLLVVVLMRGGGGPQRGQGTPPAPVGPYGGMGGPPPGAGYGGGYGSPPPGGYGMPTTDADPLAATAAAPPGGAVSLRCPSCAMMTMAIPGQPAVCFACGQPLSGELTKGGAAAMPNGTRPSGMATNPFGPSPSSATLRGAAGQFTVRDGSEVRVGRDPAHCPIFLSEPRVSAIHATLRFEGGHLMVRDESSNNGTWVSGARVASGIWTSVPAGTPLRFGPVEFAVQVEA